jgi:hypothetical protein
VADNDSAFRRAREVDRVGARPVLGDDSQPRRVDEQVAREWRRADDDRICVGHRRAQVHPGRAGRPDDLELGEQPLAGLVDRVGDDHLVAPLAFVRRHSFARRSAQCELGPADLGRIELEQPPGVAAEG